MSLQGRGVSAGDALDREGDAETLLHLVRRDRHEAQPAV
jgi:hypothetical protein